MVVSVMVSFSLTIMCLAINSQIIALFRFLTKSELCNNPQQHLTISKVGNLMSNST